MPRSSCFVAWGFTRIRPPHPATNCKADLYNSRRICSKQVRTVLSRARVSNQLRTMSTIPLMLAASAAAAVAADLTYYDVAGSPGLQGTAFPSSSKLSPFDRFPKSAQGVVSESVWSLSRDSAGLFFMFETNSKSFVTNITYLYSDTEMWHFPSTGVAGMDLYR